MIEAEEPDVSTYRTPIIYPVESRNPEEIALQVKSDPGLLPKLLDVMESDTSGIKFAYDKAVRLISLEQPELLYPHFDKILDLFKHKNSFIRWGAIATLGNLVAVDSEGRALAAIDDLLDLLTSDSMIDAANAAGQIWKFVMRFPELDDKATNALLKTPTHIYLYKQQPSPECGFIVAAAVLGCFEMYFSASRHQEKMLDFAGKALTCPREATSKRAQVFLERFNAK